MFLPDLGRLSLECPTGADAPPPGKRPAQEPSEAQEEAINLDNIIVAILANMRDADAETVCKMVYNWCQRVSKHNYNACGGNADLWRQLCERVFPNWRQEVFPPLGTPALAQFLRQGPIYLEERFLPWAGTMYSYSWQNWFYRLCYTYDRERRSHLKALNEDRQRRRGYREAVRALRSELDAMRMGEPSTPPRKKGEPPDVRAAHRKSKRFGTKEERLSNALAHRNAHTYRMKDAMAGKQAWYERHGRTRDHKDFDEKKQVPKYTPPPPRAPHEPGAPSSPDSDEGWITPIHVPRPDYDTDDERNLAAEWGWDYSDDEDPKPGWMVDSAGERRSIQRGRGWFTPSEEEEDDADDDGVFGDQPEDDAQ
jgi:hypothetical protein